MMRPVEVLLTASLLSLAVGITLVVVGRWRAAARFAHGVPGASGWSITRTGLAVAVLGVVLLVAFVVVGLTVETGVAGSA